MKSQEEIIEIIDDRIRRWHRLVETDSYHSSNGETRIDELEALRRVISPEPQIEEED